MLRIDVWRTERRRVSSCRPLRSSSNGVLIVSERVGKHAVRSVPLSRDEVLRRNEVRQIHE